MAARYASMITGRSRVRLTDDPAVPSDCVRYLVPLAGPAVEPLRLVPRARGVTIGRHERADLLLPADAAGVSRFHARITCDSDSRWWLTDLGSRWGTFVNGVKASPGRDLP